MKAFFVLLAAGLITLFAFAQAPDPVGMWVGKVEVPGGMTLHLVLHITRAADGSIQSTIDSPDQGANGFKVPTITEKDNKLTFSVFGANYEGTFSPDGKSITGTLTQGGRTFPVTFEKTEKPLDLSKPQDPKAPFPYKSEDVTYINERQKNTLAGTITIPAGKGPFPTVIMITGSGAQNRDEALLGHRPFLVIADYLSRHGIEVLRVDDRGVGGSTGSTANSTTADFVTDVEAGIKFMKMRPEVDKKRIGLIGHSEGGIIGPMVASQSPDVAFIVMMAGTGMSGRELLPLQAAAVAKASGDEPKDVEKENALEAKMLDTALNENDAAKRKEKLRATFDEAYSALTPEQKKKLGPADALFTSTVTSLESPWFRYFLTLDPQPYLEKVHCRVLVLNGSLDTQVPASANLPRIEAALKRGGNHQYEIHELPGLNHLFQHAKTGAPSEYSNIQETISPEVLRLMGDWIVK